MTAPDIDPWTSPLEDVANEVKDRRRRAGPPSPGGSTGGPNYGEWLMRVVEIRAVLESAEKARRLVVATWFLVGVTALLAAAAIVALFS